MLRLKCLWTMQLDEKGMTTCIDLLRNVPLGICIMNVSLLNFVEIHCFTYLC